MEERRREFEILSRCLDGRMECLIQGPFFFLGSKTENITRCLVLEKNQVFKLDSYFRPEEKVLKEGLCL